MKASRLYFVYFFLSAFLLHPVFAASGYERVSVEAINREPGKYVNRKVEIYGTVESVVPAEAGRAAVYRLKGDEVSDPRQDNMRYIEVYTSNVLPAPNTRVDRLLGIVNPAIGGNVTVMETERGMPPPMSFPSAPTVATGGLGGASASDPAMVSPRWPWIVGAVAAAFLFLGVAVFALFRARRPASSKGGQMPETRRMTTAKSTVATDGEITIKADSVALSLDQTVQYLPGYLEIKAGSRTGQRVPLCGGNRITIGRKTADRGGVNFIALEDPTRALSRNQAVIAYEPGSSAFTLENQSAPNPTTIDGRALRAGETIKLQDGMQIGFHPTYVLVFHTGSWNPSAAGAVTSSTGTV